MEPTGFLHKKVLLLSEYGVVLGEAQWAEASGVLLLNDQKYFYRWNNCDLSLYTKNKTLLFQTRIEYDVHTERLEKFAFAFAITWLYETSAANKIESLLVA